MTPGQTVVMVVMSVVLMAGCLVLTWIEHHSGLSDTWVGLEIGMWAASLAAFAMVLSHGTTDK